MKYKKSYQFFIHLKNDEMKQSKKFKEKKNQFIFISNYQKRKILNCFIDDNYT